MGHRPATQPHVIVESGEAAATDDPAHKSEEAESVAKDPAEPKLDEGESSRSRSETPVEIKTRQAKGKKRRSSDRSDKMELLVEKVMQSESSIT